MIVLCRQSHDVCLTHSVMQTSSCWAAGRGHGSICRTMTIMICLIEMASCGRCRLDAAKGCNCASRQEWEARVTAILPQITRPHVGPGDEEDDLAGYG